MILLIDNYDSFTYNLVQYFGALGQEVLVRRHDAISLAEIDALAPDHLVISPGPGTPDEAGISLAAIRHCAGRLPILGVCLGHQAIAQAFGARVVRAARVMHGKTSAIRHQEMRLFAGLKQPLTVTRRAGGDGLDSPGSTAAEAGDHGAASPPSTDRRRAVSPGEHPQ